VVGGQIKEDDVSSTFGMADKSTVFWWENVGNILRGRNDTIKMGLKETGSQSMGWPFCLRIGEKWWLLCRS
jgi:hypothetical protein